MTDPTSYAAGIVHNGTDHLSSTIRGWNYADGETKLTEADICSLARRLAGSRSLSPAPQAASGWRWVPVEPTPEMTRAGVEGWSANGYASIQFVWPAMLAAAPPPPAQAESGDTKEQALNAVRYLETKCREYTDRIAELEGENARLKWRLDGLRIHAEDLEILLAQSRARADRLTRAAETAREALEPFAMAAEALVLEPGESFALPDDAPLGAVLNTKLQPTLGDLRRAREALATLSAALGGKE
jgi:hypothetical protein